MKGVIFTEFVQHVESKYGLEVCDGMLEKAQDDGIYTSVGNYDHNRLVTLIVILQKLTGDDAEHIQCEFGVVAFPILLSTLPGIADDCSDVFSFIERVENHIHIEVIKLYPDSTPPKFSFVSRDEMSMVMDYHSARCMSAVCHGLLLGCAAHFKQSLSINRDSLNDDESCVRFTLRLLESHG